MEREDLLFIFAEISAAFVGFSIVVGALGHQTQHSKLRQKLMADVALIGFFVLGGSLLPVVLHANGMSIAAIWRVSSLTLMIVWVMGYGSYLMALHRFQIPLFAVPLIPKAFVVTGPVIVLIGIGLLAWNVLLGGTGVAGRYLIALLILLLIATFLFLSGGLGDDEAT